jgi:hypothetical protein
VLPAQFSSPSDANSTSYVFSRVQRRLARQPHKGPLVIFHHREQPLRREPGNRAVTDIVAPGDLARWLTVAVAAANRLALLVLGQFGFAAELNPARLGTVAPFTGAGADKVPLELREAAEHDQHQAAVRRCGVGPCIAERAETGFPIGDRRERVQQIARRARQQVEPRN